MSSSTLPRAVPIENGSAKPSDVGPNGFAALGLIEPLLRGLQGAGYAAPTPIQVESIPHALAGRDVLGCARTGTGKTAAFVLPILQHLTTDRSPAGVPLKVRALILAPTRELAAQIGQSVASYGRYCALRHLVVFGGVSQERQVRELKRGVEILIATPGRLCDLLAQREVVLAGVERLVIDEFDRMLDQGFLPSIRRILQTLPPKRQTLLFSATVPGEIEPVLAQILRSPQRVSVSKQGSTPQQVDQTVWLVEPPGKRALLERLLRAPEIARAIVFTRTKHGANRVAQHLTSAGIEADAIHGNKSQNARERALSRFRQGELRVLVATDVAARGIDIDDISHVINFDMPVDPEIYVHRIGRTARAGRAGLAVSLCTEEERPTLARIERLIGQRIGVAGQASAPTRAREPQPRNRGFARPHAAG